MKAYNIDILFVADHVSLHVNCHSWHKEHSLMRSENHITLWVERDTYLKGCLVSCPFSKITVDPHWGL